MVYNSKLGGLNHLVSDELIGGYFRAREVTARQ